MPKRNDIKKILVIGSGPIQIGQACEFDYSGSQALRALKKEGFEVVLVNSNPATIMTDPDMADRTYIEPLIPEMLEKVIEKERPDALLPTLGGQVALNLAVELDRLGVLATYGVEVLGAKIESILLAEDREKFRNLMMKIGLPIPRSQIIRTQAEGFTVAEKIGFPMILRPSFTLGGTGGGSVFNREELAEKLKAALSASPTSEVLMEESIAGWKEIEFEIMCDHKNQMVVVCTIENLDPMGIHTGDSITVAPTQTLTDKEIQRLRDACKKITEAVGIQTGGCNVQFALDPHSDRWAVVEMNPRVSRSSALASKATGFPIAKIAALLAVGYSLDEIQNDITKETPASFEPMIDYVVVKVPRFNFEKFSQSEPILGTQMKSVGETMAMGRTFAEAMHKAFNSLETGNLGLLLPNSWTPEQVTLESVSPARFDRWWLMAELLRSKKVTAAEIHAVTKIDPWFLQQLKRLIDFEVDLKKTGFKKCSDQELRQAKCLGFSDLVLAKIWSVKEEQIRNRRNKSGIVSTLNQVDTCAGEFAAKTPYYYFAYEEFPSRIENNEEPVSAAPKKKSVIVLGSGPNRIGQGVEFDYCCVKAVQALKDLGFEAIMLNCNPETVSTDYDVATRLYFEPLDLESVERVVQEERHRSEIVGVICQTGGQTALRLSQIIKSIPILGTDSKQIDRAEDREKFDRLLAKLKLRRPQSKTVHKTSQLERCVKALGYPALIRPSYVLGGRSMKVLRSDADLKRFEESVAREVDIHWPLLVDRFLEDAIEVDVDCIGDGKEVRVIAVMEHIEEAGIHSGDSSCALPPMTLSNKQVSVIRKICERLGRELKLSGFLNIQLAIYKKEVFVLEVNPRASRTLPFVCKATKFDWVKAATSGMLGESFKKQMLPEAKLVHEPGRLFAVKAVVFPFLKFPGVDVLLGPEMKSTGEVMCLGRDFNEAFVKGLLASSHRLPKSGTAFVSVRDRDKSKVVEICKALKSIGFRIVATHGTSKFLRGLGIVNSGINKVKEGQPHIVDAIINGDIDLVINTVESESAVSDSFSIRRSALQTGVPYFTTLTAAKAAINSLDRWIRGELPIMALQDLKTLRMQKSRARPQSKSSKVLKRTLLKTGLKS